MTITAKAPTRLLVLLVVTIAVSILLLVSTVQASGTLRATGQHVVEPGDTLWEIAEELAAPEGDVRRLVFDLQRMNGLDGATIVPGQVLVVPAAG